MSDEAGIVLEDVRFRHPQREFRFNLSLEPGEVLAVMGPSGAGKSTLLDLIAGFLTPAGGSIRIGGSDITALAPGSRPVSMVFQDNNLFSHLTVMQNVGLGISPDLKLSPADRQACDQAISATGLAGKEIRRPHQLSGGERQRVALARVLVRNKPVLLLDEPFASLGPALRAEMIGLLRILHQKFRPTIVMVTHDPQDAMLFCDRTAFLEQGTISSIGPTAHMLGPEGPGSFRDYLGTSDI